MHLWQSSSLAFFSCVSIPFKRESTCAQSNVKGHSVYRGRQVSIPFKRESTCALSCDYPGCKKKKFQFPSNGKAHVHRKKKEEGSDGDNQRFNSLQTGKHMCTLSPLSAPSPPTRFNSLQTGKHMCTQR